MGKINTLVSDSGGRKKSNSNPITKAIDNFKKNVKVSVKASPSGGATITVKTPQKQTTVNTSDLKSSTNERGVITTTVTSATTYNSGTVVANQYTIKTNKDGKVVRHTTDTKLVREGEKFKTPTQLNREDKATITANAEGTSSVDPLSNVTWRFIW